MAGFIDVIKKKEEFKVGGQYPKFETKKLIIRTNLGNFLSLRPGEISTQRTEY